MADTIGQSLGKMMEAAKKYASSNGSSDENSKEEAKQKMVTATNDLRNVSSDIVGIINTRKHFEKLLSIADQFVTAGNVAIEAANQSKQNIRDPTEKTEFNKVSNRLQEAVDVIDENVKAVKKNPFSPGAQLNLLNEGRVAIPHVLSFLKNVTDVIKSEQNTEKKQDLQTKSDNLKELLTLMVKHFQKTEAFANSLRYAAAQEALDAEFNELNQLKNNTTGQRKVSDGYSEISHLINRQNAVMAVIKDMGDALEAGDINEIRMLMIDLGSSVRELAKSAKDAAFTTGEEEQAKLLIETARNLIKTAGSYLNRLNKYDGSSQENLSEDINKGGERLNGVARELSMMSKNVFDSLGSENRILDLKMKLDKSLKKFESGESGDVHEEGQVLLDIAQKILGEYDRIWSKEENQETQLSINRKRQDFKDKVEDFKVSQKDKTGDELRELEKAFGSELSANLEFINRFVLVKELARETQKGSDLGEKVIEALENFVGFKSRTAAFGESIDIVRGGLLDLELDGTSAISQFNLVNDSFAFIWNGNNLLKTAKNNLDEENYSSFEEELHQLNESIINISKIREKIEDMSPLDCLVAQDIAQVLVTDFAAFKEEFRPGTSQLPDNEKQARLEVLRSNLEDISGLLNSILGSAVENDRKFLRTNAVKLAQSLEYFESALMDLLPHPDYENVAEHTLSLNENFLVDAIKIFSAIKVYL